jgi:hypothetical protein
MEYCSVGYDSSECSSDGYYTDPSIEMHLSNIISRITDEVEETRIVELQPVILAGFWNYSQGANCRQSLSSLSVPPLPFQCQSAIAHISN